MSVSASQPRPAGRRETKKAETRRRLQAQALRLFSEQGYEQTTVAELARAAGVSERTYFRYFATKPEVVLWDYFDETVVDNFRSQPAEVTVVDAFRNALRDGVTHLSAAELSDQYRRTELMMAVPELRGAHLDHLAASAGELVRLLADRTGRRADDVAITALAGAIVGITISVHSATAITNLKNVHEALDQALAFLNDGFGRLTG